MTKNGGLDVRHLDIRHSFEFRHLVFVILRLERLKLRGTATIRRYPAAAIPLISKAAAPGLEHPLV